MPTDPKELFELGNHQKIRRVLGEILAPGAPQPIDIEIANIARLWMGLAEAHLRTARKLRRLPAAWRSCVSRSYYCCYTASTAVRWFVNGTVQTDIDGHKRIGDLPSDFPDAVIWAQFLTELRSDRNLCDYEPWAGTQGALSRPHALLFQECEKFFSTSRAYLTGKGVPL